jgi:hypothetical protein
MRVVLITLLSGWVLMSVGAIVVAAPEQITRPGEISPQIVWVQNRRPDEAIPVNLLNGDQPLRVAVMGTTLTQVENIVSTRPARQVWEYTQVRVGANDNAAALLNGAGADGWEATGVQLTTSNGIAVVLKRPRQTQ